MSHFEFWTKMFNKTHGRFFAVTFQKRDGSMRRLNGNVGKIHTNDGVYITVRDVQKRAWRRVNPITIREFRCKELSL
jgi:hypothetical protein